MLSDQDLGFIYENIEKSGDQVTVIQALTGTGKTQRIPPYLYRKSGLNIFIAVPTREAARTNALRVADLNPDIKVGYAAGGKMHYDYTTSIVYATSGHVKNTILSSYSRDGPKDMGRYYLIIDEAHVESIENTMIMNLWLKARDKGVVVPNLILLSATHIYISGFTDRPIVDIPGEKPYKVLTISSKELLTDKKLYDEMVRIAVATEPNSGHVLLFVPSIRTANELADKIRNLTGKHTTALHSKTPDTDILRAFKPRGKKEFIVATNMLESSITIDGLGVVIDSMREKVAYTSGNGGKMLKEGYISEQSSLQRAGRAGRTRPGKYYKMVPIGFKLTEQKVAEYLRVPIYEEILELLIMGIKDIKNIFPRYPNLNEAYRYLAKYGAITKDHSKAELLGSFTAFTKLSIPIAKFLWLWLKSGGPTYWGVVICAIVETDLSTLFTMPQLNRTSAEYVEYIKTHYSKYYAADQLSTILNVWFDLELETKSSLRLKIDNNSKRIFDWCKGKKINAHVLVEITEAIARTLAGIIKFRQQDAYIINQNIAAEIKSLNINVDEASKTSVLELMLKCTPLFVKIFSDRIIIKRDGGYRNKKGKLYNIIRNIPCKTLDNTIPLVVLNDIENDNRFLATLIIYSAVTESMYTAPVKEEEIGPPEFWMSEIRTEFVTEFPDIIAISPDDTTLEIPLPLIPSSLVGINIYSKSKSTLGLTFLEIPEGIMFPEVTVYTPPAWMKSIVVMPAPQTGVKPVEKRDVYHREESEDAIPISFMVMEQGANIDADNDIYEQYM